MTTQATGNEISTREFRFLIPISGLFVACLLIANTTGSKFFELAGLVFPAGIVVFPISYIFGDVLTEVYGYARARRIIWTGFIAIAFAALVYYITIQIPPAGFWKNQEAFATVLGPVPRIIIASIAGYIVGEFVNSYVMAKMKLWTEGRHLWSRIIGSTVAGQAVDTAVFVCIAFIGEIPPGAIIGVIISIYIFKVAYEILATPLTYAITSYLKRAEGIDTYDRGTNFSPFRW